MSKFKIVRSNHRFLFKKLCPYCKGDLVYTVNQWEKDDDGIWMASIIESECSNMPDITECKWDDFMELHTVMPYVHQMPVDEKVLKYINDKYRFTFDNE
jgi:hypothetical protein